MPSQTSPHALRPPAGAFAPDTLAATTDACLREGFPIVRFSALRRTIAVHPQRYADSRNHVAGAVTRLSPYVTHGVIPDGGLFTLWRTRFGLTLDDALLRQLAWRGFFHHVRRHLGDAILADLHPPAHAPQARYRHALPDDVLTARTGVRVVDESVRQLYATGWLHNHQRLWLASYCVHLRKLHWRAGADWMYGHLLDGDLASNHLSWQWVAGTFGSKPYLFNAANVARFAPQLASPGSVIDTGYESLAELAGSDRDVGPSPGAWPATTQPRLLSRPPQRLPAADFSRLVRGRRVALLHPWSLARRPAAECVLGVVLLPFHGRFPWSARRWDFVIGRMRRLCDAIWVGRPDDLPRMLDGCAQVSAMHPPEPEYLAALARSLVHLDPPAHWLPEPDRVQPSFSAWMRWLRRAHPEFFTPVPSVRPRRMQ